MTAWTINIVLKSSRVGQLQLYQQFLINVAQNVGLDYNLVGLRKRCSRVTLYRSPHVFKKAKESFGVKLYHQMIVLRGVQNFSFISQVLKFKPVDVNCKIVGELSAQTKTWSRQARFLHFRGMARRTNDWFGSESGCVGRQRSTPVLLHDREFRVGSLQKRVTYGSF